jgi:hypothetical protein
MVGSLQIRFLVADKESCLGRRPEGRYGVAQRRRQVS